MLTINRPALKWVLAGIPIGYALGRLLPGALLLVGCLAALAYECGWRIRRFPTRQHGEDS